MPLASVISCVFGSVKGRGAAGGGGVCFSCAPSTDPVNARATMTLVPNGAIGGFPRNDGEDGSVGRPQVFLRGSENDRWCDHLKFAFERIDIARIVVEQRIAREHVRAPKSELSAQIVVDGGSLFDAGS